MPPTDTEKANGFGHHEEVHDQEWKLFDEPHSKDKMVTCSMQCTFPMGGLQLTRKIELSEGEPMCIVKEVIKNLNKYGRMFNIVQHVLPVENMLSVHRNFQTSRFTWTRLKPKSCKS